jgi:hypothetical protein
MKSMNQHTFAFECEMHADENIADKFKMYFHTRAVYPVRLSKIRYNLINSLNKSIDNIKTIIRCTTLSFK